MKFLFPLLVTLFTSISLFAHPVHEEHGGHLKFDQGKIHAHLSWIKGPATGSESVMKLEWHEGANHALIEPGRPFKVALYATEMHHGSKPTVIKPEMDNAGKPLVGVYDVSQMFFLMEGKWEVRVTLDGAAGAPAETQAWALDIPAEGNGSGSEHHHEM